MTRFSDLPLGGIEETSGTKILQGSSDSKALLAAARDHAAPFRARLTELTQDISGAEVAGVRAKDEAGLAEKIDAKGRSPATISDYLGGRIVIDTPDAFNRVLDAIERTGAVIDREDFITGGGKDGYRAVHLQIGLGDGMSAELQVVPSPIARSLHEAHALRDNYKRALDRGGALDPTIRQRAQQILDDAWTAAAEWHDFVPAEREARAAPDVTAGAAPPRVTETATRPAGEPRPTDTLTEIEQHATELEAMQQRLLPEDKLSAESRTEIQAAREAVTEAEGQASALERAALCIMRG